MDNNISGINPTGTPSSINVQQAGEQAISFKEQLPNLTQKLKEALMGKFNESPLWGQRETAVQGFLNQPSQTRDYISQMQKSTGVPLSPTQQGAIEGARASAAYVPLSTNTMMMGSAYGGIEDMVKSGTDAFTAASEAQTERANLLYKLQQQEFENQLAEKKFALEKSTGGSGGLTAYQQYTIKEAEAKKAQLIAAEDQAADAIQGATSEDAVNTIINNLSKEITDPAYVSKLILAGQKRIQEINSKMTIFDKLGNWFKGG